MRRERLVQKLVEAPVALIRAPAGYGKSTLLRDICETLEERGHTLRWACPDMGDTLEAFAAHVFTPQLQFVERPIDELFAEIKAAVAPTSLIIDDLERQDCAFIDRLHQLISLRPSCLQIIMAGRGEMKAGLSRLKVNGTMVEVTAEDLRFTDQETASFFQLVDIPLDPAVRGDVQRLTEGWPAALHVVRPLLQQKLYTRANIEKRLTRSSGTLGLYLKDEVLGKVAADARAFLLECGTLGRFTTELAAGATNCPNAADLIEDFVRKDLFLAPDALDDHWYRFHPLVSTWLETVLGQEDPSRSKAVHRAAAEWYRKINKTNEAIPHAFAAGDIDLAVALLEQASVARSRIGRWRAFTGWSARLPDDVLDSHPAVRIEAASAHAVLCEFEAARAQTKAVRNHSSELSERAQLNLIVADVTIATFADQPDAALAASEEGLTNAIGGDAYTLGTLRLGAALAWIGHGEVRKARGLLIEALATYRNGGSSFGAAMTLAALGLTHAIEGSLHLALAAWNGGEATVRPLETASAIESVAISYMPLVLYEQNRLDLANSYLERCFASTAEIAMPDMVTSLYLAASRLAFANGNDDRAAELLDEAEVTASQRGWHRLARAAGWERVDLALRSGRHADARRLALSLDSAEPPNDSTTPYTASDLEGDRLAGFKLEAMLFPDRKLITRLRGEVARATSGGRNWRAVRLMAIEALARENMGDRAGALRCLRRATEQGARGSMIRTFLDTGPEIVALIQTLAAEEERAPGTTPLDLGPILAAAGTAPLPASEGDAPIEPLSSREIEVLEMVAAGLSNRELASRLFVSENTIKWHLQHVFAKLGVKNRTRAVLVARKHGVIA